MSGAENGAERAENRVERAWQKTMGRDRSSEREVAERERSAERAKSAVHTGSNLTFH